MKSSLEPIAARIFETIRISTKYGSRLVNDLDLISSHFQAELNSIIEEVVAKAPIKMIFPLVLFIFPVLFILLAGSSFQEFISVLN
jgi:tight adherence protein C